MKWYAISWLRPSNNSASVLDPLSVSKRYSLVIGTQGRSRRSAASWSPLRVSSFSRTSRSLRAASHSSWVAVL